MTPRDSPDEPLSSQMVQSTVQYGEYVPSDEYYGDAPGASPGSENAGMACCRLHAGPVEQRKRRRRHLGRRLGSQL